MRKYLLFLGIGMLCSFYSYSQDFSNKGKEFWLVFPAHTPSNGQAQMGLFLTSDQNSSGTISVNGFNTTFTVIANQVTGPIDIPYANANVGTTNTVVNKGIHVVVNPGQPGVELYAHIYAGFRSEASLILPVNTLGKDYYSSNFYQRSTNGSMSQFNIVATVANTVITYQLRVNGVLSPTVNTVNLPNAGDEIQVQNANDLTGSEIHSIASGTGGCQKIAVFSGSSALAIGSSTCANPGSYDPLYQQCYPVSTWGKSFGVVPFLNNSSFHVRVMASEANTTVNFNGTIVVLANPGDYYPVSSANPVALPSPYTPAGVNPNPLLITADKSICVTQFLESANCSGSTNFPGQTNAQGDPDMVILNPVEQNISDINIFASNLQNIRTKYLNVYMKTAGAPSFTINGVAPLGTWIPMPQGNGYSYLRENLSSYLSTSFRLQADSGFNAITYGMGDAESYAYSAGTNVKDLYQQISVSTQYGIETSPSVCTNSPFKFKISLPYKPIQLTWDISGLPAATNPNTNPYTQNPAPAGGCNIFPIPADNITYACPDSITTVNGIPIYWYSIPIFYSIPTIGTYPISLIAQTSGSDGCGNEQDINFDLQVSDPPVADFNFTIPGCVADTVHFSDASVTVKPNYHWYWDFGDPGSGAANNTSSLKNPIHLFSTPGPHVVRFSSITTPGCLSDTLSKTVTVPAQPSATIAGTIAVCQNAAPPPVTITGANGAPPYIFSYHINAGPIIQTAAVPSITINVPTATAGVYTYYIDSVKNAAGSALCDTHVIGQSATVTVNPLPTATISGTTSVCQNGTPPTITFTGANGTAPYTFAYTINGVAQTPVQSPGVSSVRTITAPTGVAGPFNYTLTSVTDNTTTQCVNAVSGQSAIITVNQLPTATISGTTELCLNAPAPTITFTGAGGTAPYKFTYTLNGVAQPVLQSPGVSSVATVTVPTATAGTYAYSLVSVQESSSTTCSNNQAGTATVIVDPQPTASFTYSTPDCQSKDIMYTPTFGVSTGSVVSWVWDYGDGTGSHTRPDGNPFTINYSAAGTKTVTFKTISDKGCVSAVFTQSVIVSAKPIAGFISPQICLLDPFAQFTDTSHVPAGQPGSITTWTWDFGDIYSTPGNPNTSTAQNPTHIYTHVGPYTVQEIITSSFGCKDTANQGIYISDGNPQANYNVLNAANLCSNDSVGIINKSTIASGNITKLEIYWDLVNQPGVFDTEIDPAFNDIFKHKYPTLTTAQNYHIHVRAYSGGVCYSSKDTVITVHAAPVTQLTAIPDVCLNNGTVQFTQGSETAGIPGSGAYSGAGVSPSGLFDPLVAGVGTHVITYTYTSNFGCIDLKTTNVVVLDPPMPNFSPAAITCQNNAILFTQTSTATAGTIVSWTWHWGDGTPDETYSNGNPRPHTYTVAGTYTATLSVITNYGCKSTPKSVTFTVNPQPHPRFTFTPVACLPQAKVDFQNTTIPGVLTDWLYQWNFDDVNATGTNPNTSTATNPSHIYTTAMPFNVHLIATSPTTFCTNDTFIVVNPVKRAPVASFSLSRPSICSGQTVTVLNHSTSADGTITNWLWDYGDNSGTATGAVQQPHQYNDGTYNIMLTVTTSFGCTDDTTVPFRVYPNPTANAGADQVVLAGGVSHLQGSATGNMLSYLWRPHIYLNDSTILNPQIMPFENTTYELIVTAEGGCTATDSVYIEVLKAPLVPNTFTPNNDGIHDTWEIKYLFQYPDNFVQVFTRTGQLVFQSHGYSKPWDGTKAGTPLPFDTYYYIIEPGSGRAPITGFVTIIK